METTAGGHPVRAENWAHGRLVPGRVLGTGVMIDSSAAGRVAARSTRRGLGSCDVRNCFFASVDWFSDPSPWDVEVGNGNAWP